MSKTKIRQQYWVSPIKLPFSQTALSYLGIQVRHIIQGKILYKCVRYDGVLLFHSAQYSYLLMPRDVVEREKLLHSFTYSPQEYLCLLLCNFLLSGGQLPANVQHTRFDSIIEAVSPSVKLATSYPAAWVTFLNILALYSHNAENTKPYFHFKKNYFSKSVCVYVCVGLTVCNAIYNKHNINFICFHPKSFKYTTCFGLRP